MALFGETEDGWLTWWEFNKLRWFEADLERAPEPDDDLTRAEGSRAAARRMLLPRLEAELRHELARVRGAAAFACARSAGAAAVPRLTELFRDPNVYVRESAILALGAGASEAGVHTLLGLLVADEVPTPRARPLALVALGAARMHGSGAGVDRIVAGMLDELVAREGDALLHAALLHQCLAPSPALEARVRCATERFEAGCGREPIALGTRERALEALRFDGAAGEVLPHLLEALRGRQLEERRAAASALAALPAAQAALLEALGREAEIFARGRILLSLGEQGGAHARTFLTRVVGGDDANDVAWAGLGLGLLAGREDDEEARAALRTALAEAESSARDALLLALGLARDPAARPELVRRLGEARSDRTGQFAALALGLLGDDANRALLDEALLALRTPATRAGLKLARVLVARPEDGQRLVRMLAEERQADVLRDLAYALGRAGTPEIVGALADLLERDPPLLVRGAVLDALGLALCDDPRLAFTRLGPCSNFAVWPDWVRELAWQPL
jgi:HEAT repeat protein